jgi:hypothetical protein
MGIIRGSDVVGLVESVRQTERENVIWNHSCAVAAPGPNSPKVRQNWDLSESRSRRRANARNRQILVRFWGQLVRSDDTKSNNRRSFPTSAVKFSYNRGCRKRTICTFLGTNICRERASNKPGDYWGTRSIRSWRTRRI